MMPTTLRLRRKLPSPVEDCCRRLAGNRSISSLSEIFCFAVGITLFPPTPCTQENCAVDTVSGRFRSGLALLHYFVFLEPIHINSICFLIAYTAQNWQGARLFPSVRKIARNNTTALPFF
jgi:hypothetical protein